VTGFPPSANHFGNWKLLEIGVLLITGGTEYLCRILNPSAFGRRAEVLAGRREKRCFVSVLVSEPRTGVFAWLVQMGFVRRL